MKAELQGLQLGTKAIQKELLGILEKSKNDFLAGKEEMKRELQKMRVEAKSMTQEINKFFRIKRQSGNRKPRYLKILWWTPGRKWTLQRRIRWEYFSQAVRPSAI